MNQLMPSLVPVGQIRGASARSLFSAAAIDEAARALLAARAIATPLVVKRTGLDTFELLSGDLAYHAAARAREIDPRQAEKVLAFVAEGQEDALKRQIELFAGTDGAKTAPVESTTPALGAHRLDNFEAELRERFEGLRRQIDDERRAVEGQLEAIVQQLPQALDPLSELNGGDPRAVAELLKMCGLKGKTLEKVVTGVVEGRPYASLSAVAKATKGLSADALLTGLEQWQTLSRNRPQAHRRVPQAASARSLETV